jgi:hypothetical protein
MGRLKSKRYLMQDVRIGLLLTARVILVQSWTGGLQDAPEAHYVSSVRVSGTRIASSAC